MSGGGGHTRPSGKVAGLSLWQVLKLPAPGVLAQVSHGLEKPSQRETIPMNAHTPGRRLVATRTADEPCKAEELGRRIAAVQAKITALDESRLALDAKDVGFEDLYDELNALDLALEYAVPTSLAGVAIIVAQFGMLTRDLGDCESLFDLAELQRRVRRLHRLAMDGLMRLGGFTAEDIGAAGKLAATRTTPCIAE